MVDTPALGAGGGNPVKVQVLSSAPELSAASNEAFFFARRSRL
jgi:hypothetical protein